MLCSCPWPRKTGGNHFLRETVDYKIAVLLIYFTLDYYSNADGLIQVLPYAYIHCVCFLFAGSYASVNVLKQKEVSKLPLLISSSSSFSHKQTIYFNCNLFTRSRLRNIWGQTRSSKKNVLGVTSC